MVRNDGLPLIATKQIIEGGQSTADSLLAETTLLFQPVMIDLTIAKVFYDRGVLFIDARDDKEYREGHITGSKLAPANPGDIKRWATEDDPVVTYCSGGECDLSMNLANELMGDISKKAALEANRSLPAGRLPILFDSVVADVHSEGQCLW